MAAPPTLPPNPSEFHAFVFSNACLRVYTIVSLRNRLKRDEASQKEASRGLHWEMAALFDHLSVCKGYGPVPIPTAVVPMMQHYTDLYQHTSTPTVDINSFPFERNEYMDNRSSMMQGNKWWEALLDHSFPHPTNELQPQVIQPHTALPPGPDAEPQHGRLHEVQHPATSSTSTSDNIQAGMSQADEESHNASAILLTQLLNYASEANQSGTSIQSPNEPPGAHAPQPLASSQLSHGSTPQQPQSPQALPLQPTARPVPISPTSSNQTVQSSQRFASMSTAANPSTPYLAVSGVQPYGQPIGPAPHYTAEIPPQNGHFISYNPPGSVVVPTQSTLTQVGPPTGARPAILTSPVKKPRAKKQPKTSATVNDDPNDTSVASPPTLNGGAHVDNDGISESLSTNSIVPESEVNISKEKEAAIAHYTMLHEGNMACSCCISHGWECRTATDKRLKRCLECRLRQKKCIFPAPSAAPAPPAAAANPSDAALPAPSPPLQDPSTEANDSISAAHAPGPSRHEPEDASTPAGPSTLTRPFVPKLIAEVVVAPPRHSKRKAQDLPTSHVRKSSRHSVGGRGASMNIGSIQSRSYGRLAGGGAPLHTQSSVISATTDFEQDLSRKMSLLVDMARTAEMRLADVLGRVGELEDANRRMERTIQTLTKGHSTRR